MPTLLKADPMTRILLTLLLASVFAQPAMADQRLAQNKNCMGCHTVNKKVVGPSYKDIAAKYAGQDVSAKLATKIIKGSAGSWGAVPMPANPRVNEAEAKTLAAWILATK